jgi:uncharacterized protein YrzB (UPF0473 family)
VKLDLPDIQALNAALNGPEDGFSAIADQLCSLDEQGLLIAPQESPEEFQKRLAAMHAEWDYDLPSDGEQPEEEPEYLDILNNPDYEVLCEQHGWEHVREVMDRFTVPDDGKEYMLLFAFSEEKENQMSLATVLAVILARNATKRMETRKANPNFGCNVTKSEDGKNHFWVLVEKKEKE